jgi:hypothetical protein
MTLLILLLQTQRFGTAEENGAIDIYVLCRSLLLASPMAYLVLASTFISTLIALVLWHATPRLKTGTSGEKYRKDRHDHASPPHWRNSSCVSRSRRRLRDSTHFPKGLLSGFQSKPLHRNFMGILQFRFSEVKSSRSSEPAEDFSACVFDDCNSR